MFRPRDSFPVTLRCRNFLTHCHSTVELALPGPLDVATVFPASRFRYAQKKFCAALRYKAACRNLPTNFGPAKYHMLATEFYYQLDRSILDWSQRDQLITYAERHADEFYLIPYANGIADGNQLLVIRDFDQLPWLLDLKQRFALPVTGFALVKHHSWGRVLPHRDRNLQRSTVIATALTPLDNYADTVFWRQGKIVARCLWDINRSVILNTQETHSVDNGAETRINFQICFREPIDQVISALEGADHGTAVSLG